MPAPSFISHPKGFATTKVDKAFAKLIRQRCDLISYGWKVGKDVPQASKIDLNKHFAAMFAREWDLPCDTSDFLNALAEGALEAREYSIGDFTADEGLTEINEAVAKLPCRVIEKQGKRGRPKRSP